jgi:hypothetical protein
MITNGTLASVAIGAIAIAFGVKITPARRFTLSRTTSSCASCFALSGLGPVSSRVISSTFHAAQLLLVLLQVQPHRALHVRPEVAVQARVAGDEADFYRLCVNTRRARAHATPSST